jgi:hypothetical protein
MHWNEQVFANILQGAGGGGRETMGQNVRDVGCKYDEVELGHTCKQLVATTSTVKGCPGAKGCMKNVFNHQGNTNQNHHEISPNT